MKRLLTLAILLFGLTTTAYAQSNVATQEVEINVSEINVIAVQGEDQYDNQSSHRRPSS